MKLFLSGQWENNVSKDTRDYVAALIEHILSLSIGDMDRFLLGLQDLSVGPLRFGSTGTCLEDELPGVLEEILGGSEYTELPASYL
ncbi:MAG: hypothetical protein ACRD28_11555 [Acidobacteriaceae bacterium]